MRRDLQYYHPCSSAIQLVELFGSTRDAWMTDDLGDWLAANEIYQGVPAIVQHLRSQGPFYIVTTKQVESRKPLLALISWIEDLWTAFVSMVHCTTAPAQSVLWLSWC